jgi:cyclic pyranopterin phosphate synthase
MVDVADKAPSRRRAVAEGSIRMNAEALGSIRRNQNEKGSVLAVAQVAGILAAKRTAEWIPLCHPLPLDLVDVRLTLADDLPGVRVEVETSVEARTGVEMEALVGASAALLTVYDMCKAMDRGMEIGPVRLVEKEGGRSGSWRRGGSPGGRAARGPRTKTSRTRNRGKSD